MKKITSLQMWNDICSDARIGISKRLLGLRTTAEYLPTHSIIDARVLQLSATDGAHLKHLLTLPMEEMVSGMANFRPQLTVNGNYLAELCCSRDGAFAAVQLRQFSQLSYEPVTDVHCYEGDAALALSQWVEAMKN